MLFELKNKKVICPSMQTTTFSEAETEAKIYFVKTWMQADNFKTSSTAYFR